METLENIDWSLVLAAWGAFLSTVLAVPKVMEFWGNRFKIEVSPILRSDPEMGNELHIRNLSGKPVMLEYLELYYLERRWPTKKEKHFWSPEDELLNRKIEPAESETLIFRQGNHFGWGNGKKIYSRLYFVGKKPVVKRLGS